jgi:aminobenzoyl-glutamate utilization protein B
VAAATLVDFYTKPAVVERAWDYFRTVQTKDVKYRPFIRPQDTPATHLNTEILNQYRESMRRFYYDPARYGTYLEQLGISYPTVRACGPVS